VVKTQHLRCQHPRFQPEVAAAQGGQISLARADGVGGGEAAAAAPTEAEAEASARFQLALLLLERAKREEALAELKKAIVLDSQDWLIRKQMWALETPDAFTPVTSIPPGRRCNSG